ncbi:phage tail tape measure protein [Nocardioides sp. Kera G14]|uniref:phage tail tape measure protein n=1 Tax=Nocardioides sp. Kera G14 TaxID=2884264 RepID=UPI001D116E30|nr:phage tail tape measure protein [Nocardioides sp. Kera G14]UDY22392.1 phage tail tape measure protein [Nocardioides sp. Kera G14]
MTSRTVEYVFKGSFTNLTAGLTAASRSVNEYSNRLNALDAQGRQMRASLSGVADTAGKMGIVAAAGFGVVIGAAANFEQAMSHVKAATHETAGNMDALKQAALDAGAATSYSATEAAGAIEDLAKAGISTKDILGGGLSGALSLAAAGSLDVGEAAEDAASAMTQFKLAGKDVPHIADLLAAGAGKANGSVSDLAMALNQSGLVAAQTGLSIEETTGALAAFASAGLEGSDAGTSMKTALQSLTPTSSQAAKLMDQLGIKAYDQQGNFIGLAKYAGVLQEKLSGMSAEQRNATLKTIFGSDAVRAASVLYEQGATGIQSWIDKVNDQGYAAETAALNTDNLIGDLERFKGSLETAFIGAGEGAQSPLRALVQGATEAVNALQKIPNPMQETALAALGLTAVFGGGLWFTSKTISGIATMRTAMIGLGVSEEATLLTTQRLGTALKGLAIGGAAIGAGIALSTGFDKLAGDTGTIVDSLKNGDRSRWTNPLSVIGYNPDHLGDTDPVTNADASLAALVQSGNAKKAADQFKEIADAAERQGVSLKDVTSKFPEYQKALDGTSTSATTTSAAVTGTTGDLSAQADALAAAKDAATATATGFVGLGDSLNDSKVSLSSWIDQMREQASALRDFTKNCETAARKGLDEGLIASLEAAGPEGAMRLQQLAGASEKEIKRANRAWRSGQSAISDYVSMAVPPKTITVNVDPALQALRSIKAEMRSLPETLQTTYYVNQVNALNKRGQHAAGGYIVGPGTATSDSIPAYLSNGEYVMRAAAVARYGTPFMDALNSGSIDAIDSGAMAKDAYRLAAGGAVRTRTSSPVPSLKELVR